MDLFRSEEEDGENEEENEELPNKELADENDDGLHLQGEELETYDSDSDSTSEFDSYDDFVVCDDDLGQPVAKETIFLIGGRSRYGRSIRINKKFL